MANASLFDFNGEPKGKVDLPTSLFEGTINRSVLYDAVVTYLRNRRSGTAKVKSRGEVSFGNAKPYRQKGTGRARAGRRSSPIWRSGGVVFGPAPRDYRRSIPKKVKRLALKSALIDKGNGDAVIVVDGVRMSEPKTKRFIEFLRSAGLDGKKTLFIMDAFDENVFRSMSNIPGVEFILSRNMNAYDILKADVLLFTKDALVILEEVFAE